MSIEAMKQALEALKDNQHLVADNERHAYVMEYNAIIEKLEEALAKQEQRNVSEQLGEPVVGTKTWFEDGKVVTQNLYYSDVYTTPQRTWVGLTDEQFAEACRLAENGNYLVAFQRIQNWIKEKLKEKNT